MRLGFLITGLVILLAANILMVYYRPGSLGPSSEGFSNYFLENSLLWRPPEILKHKLGIANV